MALKMIFLDFVKFLNFYLLFSLQFHNFALELLITLKTNSYEEDFFVDDGNRCCCNG